MEQPAIAADQTRVGRKFVSKEIRKPSPSAPSLQYRPGESFVVPVTKRIVPLADGTSLSEATIRLEDVPIPERRYVADMAWLESDDQGVRFFFGQYNLRKTELRSLVSVHMYAEPVRNFLKTCVDFIPQITGFIERNGITTSVIRSADSEPEQTVLMIANMISAGTSGREAVLDFLHVSPAAMRKLATTSQVAVDPVVRIDLPTSCLLPLLNELEAIAADLPPEAK